MKNININIILYYIKNNKSIIKYNYNKNKNKIFNK